MKILNAFPPAWLVLISFFPGSILPQVVLSELMGDPSCMSDGEGEYIELINSGSKPASCPILAAAVDLGASFSITGLTLAPRQIFLFCRDSAAMDASGIYCNAQWPSLSISNASPHAVRVRCGADSAVFFLLHPLSGKSWENSLDVSKSFGEFREAELPFACGDKGSPGALFSGSRLPLNRDLSIDSLTPDTSEPGRIFIHLTNRGLEAIPSADILISRDTDWDGIPEILADSIAAALDLEPGRGTAFSWQTAAPNEGLTIVRLGTDENLSNNSVSILHHPSPSLAVSEVCPGPPEAFPEWIEIKNVSRHDISFKSLYYNRTPLSAAGTAPVLKPGGVIILTESIARFQDTHPDLKLNLLEVSPWDILKNTGDTVTLSFSGSSIIDRMAYKSIPTSNKGACLARDSYKPGDWYYTPDRYAWSGSPEGETSTPGFDPKQDSVFSWRVWPGIIDITHPDEVFSIHATSPLSIQYNVTIFDMGGVSVRKLCSGCSGAQDLTWDGKDDKGQPLPAGPYILLTASSGGASGKKVLILARPL